MATITPDAIAGVLAAETYTSATSDTGAVPPWARVMTITRLGVYGTDDATLTLTDGTTSITIAIAATGAPVAVPLAPPGAGPDTVFTAWTIAGTGSIQTTVQFDRGLIGG